MTRKKLEREMKTRIYDDIGTGGGVEVEKGREERRREKRESALRRGEGEEENRFREAC